MGLLLTSRSEMIDGQVAQSHASQASFKVHKTVTPRTNGKGNHPSPCANRGITSEGPTAPPFHLHGSYRREGLDKNSKVACALGARDEGFWCTRSRPFMLQGNYRLLFRAAARPSNQTNQTKRVQASWGQQAGRLCA